MAFSYKASITILHTQVQTTDQANFPVLVSGTYAGASSVPDLRSTGNGGHVQSSSGYDIQFFSDSSLTTRLAAEREIYVASTGQLIAWVKVPSVSHTSDTVIYIGYGDSGISTDPNSDGTYGKTNTWDSNYLGVFHMADGTTLSTADSTSHGTTASSNSGTATTGQVDGGISYVKASSQTTDYGNNSLYNMGTNDWTASLWMKSNTTAYFFASLMNKYNWDDGASAPGWEVGIRLNTIQVHFTVSSEIDITGAVDISSVSSWHYITVTFTRSGNAQIYVDGVADTSAVISGQPGSMSNLKSFQFSHNGANVYYFDGSEDEMRVSNIARSADWIKTEYNNQSSPSTFYTMGTETINGGGGTSFFRLASQGVG